MARLNYKVGDKDHAGRKIVQVAEEGWYKCEDGSIRDENGHEWFGHTSNQPENTVAPAKVEHDDITGQKIVIRDFKIAMMVGQSVDPQKFLEHYRPIIEQTMMETGWDYADEKKGVPNMVFGEGRDGYAHIHVRMKKRNWKNRANIYDGARQGQSGKVISKALVNAGALDPHIYGAIETDRQGGDILGNK